MSILHKSISALLLAMLSTSAFAITNAQLFAYAEATYPAVFTGTPTTGQYLQYSYQYYPASGNYLAVDATGMLHMMGVATANAIRPLGAVTTFATTVNAWNPTVPLAGAVAAPITTSYFDFNYQQNVNGIPVSTTSSIVDNGINSAGSVTFGVTGATTTTSFTPTAGGYTWGAPMTSGMGWNSNATDANAPAVIQVCEAGNVPTKSVEVLVESSATPLTSAAQLAGMTFTTYVEDCGASSAGSTLTFDSLGGATIYKPANAFVAGSTVSNVTITQAQVTAALNGTPYSFIANSATGQTGYGTFNAYSYRTAYGLTKYAVVYHIAPAITGNVGKGVIALFL